MRLYHYVQRFYADHSPGEQYYIDEMLRTWNNTQWEKAEIEYILGKSITCVYNMFKGETSMKEIKTNNPAISGNYGGGQKKKTNI